jgi:hypothetical protein
VCVFGELSALHPKKREVASPVSFPANELAKNAGAL